MNVIQESMKNIQASEELKKSTLRYLEKQKGQVRPRRIRKYLLAAACLVLIMTVGGIGLYARPVSYISIDVNPSIELGVNRFGRVVSEVAYNVDGENILEHVKLKNMAYDKAIDKLLKSEDYAVFLTEGSHLVFTVISDDSDAILRVISENERSGKYRVSSYSSDMACREEAHQQEMSFGKYRACQELAQYDETVTMEECYKMTMGEICDHINTCKRYRHRGSGHGNYGNGCSGNSGSENDSSENGGIRNGSSENGGSGNDSSGNSGLENNGSGNGGGQWCGERKGHYGKHHGNGH